MILAGSLYEQGRLSLGQAAAVANLSKRTFAELLGTYNVSLFNYPATELEQDIINANAYAL
jgi:predicted HTH domain antitoxin